MIQVGRVLGALSAVLSSLLLLRPRNGFLSAALWFPRAAVGAWSPILALAGSLAALFGVLRKDRWSFAAGLVGATVAVRYLVKVTARHSAFEEAFGPDWQARIPPELQSRMLPRRYSPNFRPASKPIQHSNLVYAIHPESGTPLEADLWLPPPDVPPTGVAVLYLFGGAWHYMNKDLWTGHILRYMASQGHIVLNASYTLAPKADLPAMIADVKRAIAWLEGHATEYGADPERIVLMGCSSGAHLALLTAYAAEHPAFQPAERKAQAPASAGVPSAGGLPPTAGVPVRGVISDSGFADLTSSYAYFQEQFGRYLGRDLLPERWFLAIMGWVFRRLRLLPSWGEIVIPSQFVPSLLGGRPDEMPESYRLASPIAHAGPHCPPTLLLQGANDYCGVRPDVRRLYRALCAAGVPTVYVEYAEADHSYPVIAAGALRWAPAIQAAFYDIERFLGLMV